MERASAHLPAILRLLSQKGCVLLLDFDGTLSNIVKRHGQARISPRAKRALLQLSKHVPVAIISGRSVFDVRRRVGIPGIAYAGCHGLERFERGQYRSKVSPRERAAFVRLKRALREAVRHVKGLTIEDKGLGFALHCRALLPKERRALEQRVAATTAKLHLKKRVRIYREDHLIEVVPTGGHKGVAARELLRALSGRKKRVPVYIGDSLTDEDAFRALKSGITIRVGRKRGSIARYYFSSRSETDVFLTRLSATMVS